MGLPNVFNILCWKRDRPRGPCNEIRILELILCLACFGLTFVFVLNGVVTIPVFLTLFSMVGFIFILLVDIVVITAWFPIGWRAWILISLSASLYYFTCCGLSFVVDHPWYLMGTVAYFITALVFLMDCLFIIWLVRLIPEVGMGPRACPTACKASQVTPLPTHYEPYNPQSLSQDQMTQTASSRLSENKSIKWHGSPASYGGTFHMSRDIAPMPGPDPIPPSQSIVGSENYESFQMVEEEPIRGNRTVAVMTRIKPRQPYDVDLTPLRSPFEEYPQPELHANKGRKKYPKMKLFKCKPQSHGTSSTNSPRSQHTNDSDYSSPRVSRTVYK
ncbi:hypothetical protein Trydic_g354 [Trypoxylus dichotomus]